MRFMEMERYYRSMIENYLRVLTTVNNVDEFLEKQTMLTPEKHVMCSL